MPWPSTPGLGVLGTDGALRLPEVRGSERTAEGSRDAEPIDVQGSSGAARAPEGDVPRLERGQGVAAGGIAGVLHGLLSRTAPADYDRRGRAGLRAGGCPGTHRRSTSGADGPGR